MKRTLLITLSIVVVLAIAVGIIISVRNGQKNRIAEEAGAVNTEEGFVYEDDMSPVIDDYVVELREDEDFEIH